MYIGIDIGGTKCAVIKADITKGGELKVEKKASFKTESCEKTVEKIINKVEEMLPCRAIGISCGGPLDEKNGIIMSPPNLIGWDNVHITDILKERFNVPVSIMNDANACALAEWRFGAGRGTENMVFLTFGTGLGAGLIINGKLYSGANGNAGEVGHMRLAEDGPSGYGKSGSFEGFCSGGGIGRLAAQKAMDAIAEGRAILGCKSKDDANKLTAKDRADMARRGDEDAIEIYRESGRKLGLGLSYIIDALNPEAIVIGSVYQRSKELFSESMYEVLNIETLKESLGACKILPAELGDSIGDYAAISVALECKEKCSNNDYISNLVSRFPSLICCETEIRSAVCMIQESYSRGGKILLCGNGGSAADCEHIAGELLKGFLLKREEKGERLEGLVRELGDDARKLQGGIPAIPLPSLSGVVSAFNNDVDASLVYAQLVCAFGRADDVLLAFSTSGNSENVVKAVKAARALGIPSIAFTGETGGKLYPLADVCIRVPEGETYKIQEYHLPVYHAICAEVEKNIFGLQ